MAEVITCKICSTRRAKRACPAVHGDICAICCGEQREVTLSCPLDCGFLREAHRHEKAVTVPAEQISNPEINITEDFIRSEEELLLFCVYSLLQACLRTSHAVDTDCLAALAALIKTHHTAESGLIYETRAENTVAASIQQKFSASLKDYKSERPPTEEIFKMQVFLHRIGQQNQNGRPKGRMFIDLLRAMVPETKVDERAPSIIL